MFGVNKNYILEKCGWTCDFIAFHMHHGCVKENKNCIKWKKEKKFKKHDDEK